MPIPSRAALLSSKSYQKEVSKADDPLGVGLMPAETEEQRMRRNDQGIKNIQESMFNYHPSWIKMSNFLGLESAERLGEVIANQEGYYAKKSKKTRPQKNNNPGNLRAVDRLNDNRDKVIKTAEQIAKERYGNHVTLDKDGFVIFPNASEGWSALYKDLRVKAKKSPSRGGVHSNTMPTEFVNRWASTSPEEERVTYIKAISDARRR